MANENKPEIKKIKSASRGYGRGRDNTYCPATYLIRTAHGEFTLRGEPRPIRDPRRFVLINNATGADRIFSSKKSALAYLETLEAK